MKTLNASNLIIERVKVKPVTNAELKKAQDEYKRLYIWTLCQGDIIYFRNRPDIPYIVIMNESLYKQVMLKRSLDSYDFTKGVILNMSQPSDYPNFMVASDYTDSLKYKTDHDWDIVKVYRGELDSILQENIRQLINIDNLKQLVKDFKLVFENGKWL